MFSAKFQTFDETADPAAAAPRIAALRAELKRLGLDGFVVPRADRHQNEYVPASEERIAWLVKETNISREELLSGLSGELPDTIDKLTPEGRLPTDEELSRNV